MNRKIIVGLAAALLTVGAAACKSSQPKIAPALTASDEALFKEGEKLIKKDAEKARLYLRQIIDSFPKSFYAQRAKLAIADSYFRQGDEANLVMAAAEYQEFIRLFPYSPSASQAQLQVALCSYNKTLKPGRDQGKTLQALAELKKVLSVYPLSEEAKTAREKIANCEERLAEHEYLIGKYYFRIEAYQAAVNRLTGILTNYPLYKGMDKVYFTLGTCYLEWGKPAEAIPFLTKLTADFPKSPLAVQAKKRLSEAEAKKTPVKKSA